MSFDMYFNDEINRKNELINFINSLYEEVTKLRVEINYLKMKPEIERIKELEEENNRLWKENSNFKYANELSFNNKELEIIEKWNLEHKKSQKESKEIKPHFLRYSIYLTKVGPVKRGECDCGCYVEICNGKIIKK